MRDSTGFDQAKAIIGRKRDYEPEKFCSLNQVINEDCLDLRSSCCTRFSSSINLKWSCFMSFEIETLQNKQSLLKRMIRHTLLLTFLPLVDL